jgi:hypothetical protein
MEGTVTQAPPHSVSHALPHQPLTRVQVEELIDSRLQLFAAEFERRTQAAEKRVEVKQKMKTYGVSGVVGLVAGIGGTLLVQRIRRGKGGAGVRP